MSDTYKLQYNGMTLAYPGWNGYVGYENKPVYNVLYSHAAQINYSNYGTISTSFNWSSNDVILFYFKWWSTTSTANGCIAINPPNDSWRVNLRKYGTSFGSGKWAVERGNWFKDAVIDNSSVTTKSLWGATFLSIPNASGLSSTPIKVIVDRTNTVTYLYYNNNVRMFHRNAVPSDTKLYYWPKESSYMKDCYVVGCSTLQQALDWAP